MNKKYILLTLCLFSMFMVSETAVAQCDNIVLSLETTNSTCAKNGTIKVNVSGGDLANLNQTNMQFEVRGIGGSESRPASFYANNTIEQLAAGTYEISLSAFCNATSSWFIASSTATATITSTYETFDARFGIIISSLSCLSTGIAPIVIESGTGLAPFTIEITQKPAAYTGQTTFATSLNNYAIENLPTGTYTFVITDACGATIERTTVVDTYIPDPNAFIYSPGYNFIYPAETANPYTCNLANAWRNSYWNSVVDQHYLYYNSEDYFEVAFIVDDTGTKIWQPFTNRVYIEFTIPSPYTIRTLREGNHVVTPYIRVRGTDCEFRLNELRISSLSFERYTSGCGDNLSSRFRPSSYTILCYPYKWKVLNSDDSEFMGWQSPVFNNDFQTATNIPANSKIQIEDYAGETTIISVGTGALVLGQHTNTYGAYPYTKTDGFVHSNMTLALTFDTIPAGTRIQFVDGPSTPIHTDTTLANNTAVFYPFSPTGAFLDNTYYIKPGTYTFTVTFPGCPAHNVIINANVFRIITSGSYDLNPVCGGMSIVPTAGKIELHQYSGTIVHYDDLYYKINDKIPYSSNINHLLGIYFQKGEAITVTEPGQYTIGLHVNTGNYSPLHLDTITYTHTPFGLDETALSHYMCQGELTGFIKAQAKGGSGNYRYELYDNNVLKLSNTTGVFNYGTVGNTYEVVLYDAVCNDSYTQPVTLIDLGIAQIAFTDAADNRFCLSDSIRFKCLTLGETTYTWSGPGINATNQNQQNPIIYADDIGPGTYTYTIRVTPESCGTEIQQDIIVTVIDCSIISGAFDDYVTIFKNNKDTIAILANDIYPPECASSVNPVKTIGPMLPGASAVIVNGELIYTPEPDFVGLDSVKYSVTCGNRTVATVYINVIEKPDNIIDADCVADPQPSPWSIKEIYSSASANHHSHAIPLVGDINGDGIPEIITVDSENLRQLNILWGDGTTSKRYIMYPIRTDMICPYAICKTNIGGVDKYIVIVTESNGLGHSAFDLNEPIYSPALWSASGGMFLNSSYAMGIADFDNDGIPEFYHSNRVFDTRTGYHLAIGDNNPEVKNIGLFGDNTYFSIAANITGNVGSFPISDESMEIIAGAEVYSVIIPDKTISGNATNSLQIIKKMNDNIFFNNGTKVNDGATVVADINQDGRLDVIFVAVDDPTAADPNLMLVAWDVKTGDMLYKSDEISSDGGIGIPFVGNIDENDSLEVVFAVQNRLLGFKPNSSTKKFDLHYSTTVVDASGSTGITLFDLNQDGISEIIYQDEAKLRIMHANESLGIFESISEITNTSSKGFGHPVIADIDNDGAAEIIVISNDGASTTNGFLKIYKSGSDTPWAPARKVWNQYAYNAVNVNEDLSIPKYQVNPASVLSGNDGIFGTADDVQPYNAFRQQQTMLNQKGVPSQPAPDAIIDQTLSTLTVSDDDLIINACFTNMGDVPIGSPIFVTLYENSIDAANIIAMDSALIQVAVNSAACVPVTITNAQSMTGMTNIVVRINDKNGVFDYHTECDTTNNVMSFGNPFMMDKDATLLTTPPLIHRGTYPNPVSVLYNEEIEYRIKAVNINQTTGSIIIYDTIPTHLKYVASSATGTGGAVTVDDSKANIDNSLMWTFTDVPPQSTRTAIFNATPISGVAASQPLFINQAWIQLTGSAQKIATNSTYHQGAGISIMTFSAGFGGNIYNAGEQALDYMTQPSPGIIIAPDEGFRFAGWSHGNYTSLRGAAIAAQDGIMLYDMLTVYGNIELHASFVPEEYTIVYYLNGSENAKDNPEKYTIKSGMITLEIPKKEGDTFIGWTGSNGNEPQQSVVIASGTTGEQTFYANFLYSGREDAKPDDSIGADKVWAIKDELFIRTSKAGSIVRIHTLDGVLREQRTIVSTGLTTMKLSRGIYVITINNKMGKKVRIE